MSSSSTRTVRIGVLCVATIVKKNARGISLADGIEIVAIGSSSGLDKAQGLVKELQEFLTPGLCQTYGSYDEVLDLKDLDAIYIPLPSAQHVPWVQKAAAKGLHILLEKPLAAKPEDLEAIMTACKKHNVQLMDGTMWSHHPRTRQMESIIRDTSKFGPVLQVNATLNSAVDDEFLRTNIRNKTDGDPLGCLGDYGWYCTRAAIWAFNGEAPEMVWAHPGANKSDKGIPLYVGATLVWPGTPRRRAVYTCGFDLGLTQAMEVYSAKASVYVRDFQTPFDEKKCTFMFTHDHGFGDLETHDATKRDEITVETPQPQETYMWEEFANNVRNVRDNGGKPDQHWMDLAYLTQKTLSAVDMSLQKGNVCIKVADLQPCSEPST